MKARASSWRRRAGARAARVARVAIAAITAIAPAALVATIAMAAVAAPALAQESSRQALRADLREEVLAIRKPGFLGAELETTLYRPPGDGPFPLVVVNHGKASGNPRFQERARFGVAAAELVHRGYAVVIPMRQGFSKSSGSYIGGGCNVESNGRAQAEDVAATIAEMAKRPDIDARRVVVFGQSHGGLTTMAVGALELPNVVGLVNFSGGLRQENCSAWEAGLASAMAEYARRTQVPSLWFYGDNDSYFAPAVWRRMHEEYVGAGGRARLVAFGPFGTDSHTMFFSARGPAIWLPEVEAFFKELGLPFELQP